MNAKFFSRAWIVLPLMGVLTTAFPLSVLFFPWVVMVYIRKIFFQFHQNNMSQAQHLLRWTAGLQIGLAGFAFFFHTGMFLKMVTVLWHGWSALFWLAYERGMVAYPRRLSWFLAWSGAGFVLGMGVIGADYFFWDGMIRTDLYHQILQQAGYLREALFQSKMSPYQLPGGIRPLLEQGAEIWSQQLMGQVVITMYVAWMVLFFFYWNLCDTKGVRDARGPLFWSFQLPDWTMVILILCLAGWVLAQYGGKNWGLTPHLQEVGATVGWSVLVGVLGWYVLEGISLVLQWGMMIRRFWIFFGLALLVFFDAQWTAIGMMALGVGAQIRRFLPKKA